MEYTLIFIFNPQMDQVLMMHKTKGPECCLGRLNGVGGKIDPTDNGNVEFAAYREVKEEVGLEVDDIYPLIPLVKEIFPSGTELNVFYTRLYRNSKQPRQREEEPIEWIPVRELLRREVTDDSLAGGGNIPYLINQALLIEDERRIKEDATSHRLKMQKDSRGEWIYGDPEGINGGGAI